MLFVGTLLIITGGRSKGIQEILPTDVYDTENSEWKAFNGIGLFRHMAFNKDNYLFIYGGFENTNPNNPVEKILKVDLTQYFSSNTTIQNKIEQFIEYKKEKDRIQDGTNNIVSNKNIQSIESNNKQEKKFKLSNQAVVLKCSENINDDNTYIRKVSIDKLNDEGKRIGFQNIRPDIQGKRVYNENLISKFIDTLLRPFDWFEKEVEEIHNNFPFSQEEIESLLNETLKVIVKESTLVKIKSPAKIFGNLFGQYVDLMRIFESYGHPSDDNSMGDVHLFHYVFLGDYVDRGFYSLEVILLLFALKVNF
jgi:protein phosphatase